MAFEIRSRWYRSFLAQLPATGWEASGFEDEPPIRLIEANRAAWDENQGPNQVD